jgi:hypothetical protein
MNKEVDTTMPEAELHKLLADPNLLASEREALTRLLAVTVAIEALAAPEQGGQD